MCVSCYVNVRVRFLKLSDFRECNWWRFRCFELLVSSLPFPFPVVFMLLQCIYLLIDFPISRELSKHRNFPQISVSRPCTGKLVVVYAWDYKFFLKELMQYWRSLWRKERVKDHWTWCDRHSAINLVVSRIILHQPQNWGIGSW